MALEYANVTGIYRSTADSPPADGENQPVITPLVGSIEFAPSIEYVHLDNGDILGLEMTVVELDSMGRPGTDGTPGVILLSPHSAGVNPQSWHYTVRMRLTTKDGTPVRIPEFRISPRPGPYSLNSSTPVPSGNLSVITRGLSAYEVAVAHGFIGTVGEWLESLRGGGGSSTGPAGPPNTLSIGTVTTLPSGSAASAAITGEAPAQVLSLALPAGTDGASGRNGKSAYELAVAAGYTGSQSGWLESLRGAAGGRGLDGKDAYELAVANGFIGTRTLWLQSLRGPQGDIGPIGKSAYQHAVDLGFTGTIPEWMAGLRGTNGQSAYEAAVSGGYSGTQAQWLASLRGSDGKSAYELARESGYGGTLTQWLATLRGADGEDGADGQDGANGLSAYEVAVANGFTGTQVQWLASLKGADGEDGADGNPGAGTITRDTAPAGTTFTNVAVNGVYPARGTSRADIIVRWRGPVMPAAFLDGTDEWIQAETTAPPVDPGIPEDYDVAPGGNIQIALNSRPEGTTIKLPAGEYRLSTRLLPKADQTIEGPDEGYAILRGDVPLNGWVREGMENRWYTTSGGLPNAYTDTGQCEWITGENANACHKREQVWIGGQHMKRVMTVDQVSPSTFYQDYESKRTYIGIDPATLAAQGRAVEMSKTDYAINTNVPGLKLANLIVKRFASPGQKAAVTLASTNCEVSYCMFTENHAIGLHITVSNGAHIHHNEFVRNGQLGMGHHRSHNTIVEHNEFTENNTDQFWRADWESGGFKATYSNGTVFRYNTAHNNEGIGIWFDIDNKDILIHDNTSTDNYADGIRYEISQKGTIYDNLVTGNGFRYATGGGRGQDYSMFAVAGINVNSTPDVEVYGNTVLDNQNGICFQSRNRGNSENPEYGVRETRNAWVHHNRIRQSTGSLFGEGIAAGLRLLGITDTAPFYGPEKNNRFDHNTYELPSASDLRFAWNQSYMHIASFKTAGQEANGVITALPRPGIRINNTIDDGYVSPAVFSSTGASALIGSYDAGTNNRQAYLRFNNVNIAQGAVVQSASIEVKTFGIDGTIPGMVISGHAADNSTAATTRAELFGRARTTATVPWAPAQWVQNAWVDTPDLKAIVQEIVNRPGWVRGGSMTFFIAPTNPAFTTRQQVSFRTIDNLPADAPGLKVAWV